MFSGYSHKLAQQISNIPNTPANSAIRQRDQQNLALLQTLSVVAVPVHISQLADPPLHVSRGTPFLMCCSVRCWGSSPGWSWHLSASRSIARSGVLPRSRNTSGFPSSRISAKPPSRAIAPREDPSDAAQLALTKFGALRRNVELIGSPTAPRIVAVTSPGPQEGKTTVSAALATSFARAGRRTVVVETDMRRPQLAAKLGVAGEPGLSDYLRGDSLLSEVLEAVDQPLSRRGDEDAPTALACLTAGAPVLAPDELLARARFGELLQELADDFDVVVIDAPPVLPVPDSLEILPLVEAWLVCVRAGRTTLPELDALKETLARLPAKPAGAVITGVSRREYQAVGYVTERQYATVPT